ncbi:PREDICTED: brain-specific angiogenesis inhibitor 1-associated protein 2-like protein 2 isoform X2 [Gavialis gangeticus]|uniref:brain-specific angiogenesis inhibitor 1-associated protein 2-like protein 2 isoform X2 n=1 Tax=Gavialis gangeticus TaxID=94835 RepID=UPI00092E41E3|nr:PREDICTED: brain-specific angiogenesis inhibitor 1-associated protein 2-like protein 2 isoform X2 [Gavialis gangeticus]
MEESYRSTISIYKSILEQFNPALVNLVYLGNNYLRAFHALSEAAEIYFKAIQKIGEQALQSSTSQILGQILMQMSDTQRLLNSDLEVVAQKFHVDVLQHMEKNTKLDMQFINDSRQRYELEYQRRAANLDKCVSEHWKLERTRDKSAWDMKENVRRLHLEMQAFVSESQKAAELEEKRRYRFLAEKHQLLSNTFLQFYNRARGIIQNKVPLWKEQLEATRNLVSSHSQSRLCASSSSGYLSDRLTPSHLEMSQRPLGDYGSALARQNSSTFSQESSEMISSPQPEFTQRTLQRSPSAGSLSTGQRSRCSSFGEPIGGEGGGGGNRLRVQAIVPHSTGTNRTLLQFNTGDVITVLMPDAQNGWLYGKLEGLSTCGWFPEAYVKPMEEIRHSEEPTTRSFPLRSSHSMDNLLDRPSIPSASNYWHNAAQPQSPSSSRDSGSCRSNVTTNSSDSKKSSALEQPPELFPRGTNPFATVKLRPTVTNDRSAPVI